MKKYVIGAFQSLKPRNATNHLANVRTHGCVALICATGTNNIFPAEDYYTNHIPHILQHMETKAHALFGGAMH
jgi:2-iminoacetate synthase ThiH